MIGAWLHEMTQLIRVPASGSAGRLWCAPSVAAVSLTRRCNSRCAMCGHWTKRVRAEDEMSFGTVVRVLGELRGLGVRVVSLSAEGEIFTRRDAPEILRAARGLGLEFSVNTNALAATPEIADAIAESRPYTVTIGLDTHRPEVYERIRGIPDGLDRVRRSIALLHERRYERIAIGAVIVRENAGGLVDLASFARDLGVRNIRFTAFQPYGFSSEAAREDLRPYRDPEFLAALREEIDRLIAFKQRTHLIGNPEFYLRKVPEFYARGFAIRAFPCVVGYYRVHVGPDGDVRLCGLMPETRIGNAAERPIVDLWRLPEAQAIRRRLHEGDCLRCWLSCYAEDNMRFFPRTMLAANGGAVRRILGLKRGRGAPAGVP